MPRAWIGATVALDGCLPGRARKRWRSVTGTPRHSPGGTWRLTGNGRSICSHSSGAKVP